MRLSTTIVSVLSSCGFFAPPQSSILFASWDQSEKNDAPDPDYCCGSHAHASRANGAHPAPGVHSHVTDMSAAKKHKKAKAPKEEYLKAAPGTGPSGPKK